MLTRKIFDFPPLCSSQIVDFPPFMVIANQSTPFMALATYALLIISFIYTTTSHLLFNDKFINETTFFTYESEMSGCSVSFGLYSGMKTPANV
jgi:hypothetical protein